MSDKKQVAYDLFSRLCEMDFDMVTLTQEKKTKINVVYYPWLVMAGNDETMGILVMAHITDNSVFLDIYHTQDCKTMEIGTYTHSDIENVIEAVEKAKDEIRKEGNKCGL